jgi:hypothetical protein
MGDTGEEVIRQLKSNLQCLWNSLNNLHSMRSDSGSFNQLHIDRIITRNIGIVGEEGAGKSTLINAIFGQSLVPTDAIKPGTVAPISITSRALPSSQYIVKCHNRQEDIECADLNEFSEYLLQGQNPENAKKVVMGYIHASTPHLTEGTEIIDMPGLQGVSEKIRREARDALALIDGALIVISDRNVGPGIRIAAELEKLGCELDAVIINLRSSKFFNHDTHELFDDSIIGNNIAEIREFVWEVFSNFKISMQQIFALYIPSMKSLAISPNSPLNASRYIVEEINRFAAWFRSNYGNEGIKHRLAQALELTSCRLEELADTVHKEASFFIGLRNGDDAAIEYANDALTARKERLSQIWQEAVDGLDLHARSEILIAVKSLKERLRQLHAKCIASLPNDKSNWDVENRDWLVRKLNTGTAAASSELTSFQIEILDQYTAICHMAAQSVIESENDILKYIDVQLNIPNVVFPNLWVPPVFVPQSDEFFDFEWLWCDKSIDRLLEQISDCEIFIDTTKNGAITKQFDEQLKIIRIAQFRYLEKYLAKIPSVVFDKDSFQLKQIIAFFDEQKHHISEAQKVIKICWHTLLKL